jgi:multidrug efflux pump
MGIVLFTGLSIGTLFTLFIVPAVYVLLGADHAHDRDKRTASNGGSRPASPSAPETSPG